MLTLAQEDWKVGANDGVTSADVDAKYEAIINKTTNGTYSTHGPIVLSHELSESSCRRPHHLPNLCALSRLLKLMHLESPLLRRGAVSLQR